MGKLSKVFQDARATESVEISSLTVTREDAEAAIVRAKSFDEVRPRVDYSDFSNFVFFNSALDYFNITGEKLLNDWPADGSSADRENFLSSLDGYESHVYSSWPRRSGYLRFDPSVAFSYVALADVGLSSGESRADSLSPGTSSFSLECWAVPPPALTGSDDVMVLFHNSTGSVSLTTFFSGSSFCGMLTSGSFVDVVSAPVTSGESAYLCLSLDRDLSLLSVLTGSLTSFPVPVASTSLTVGALRCGPSYAFIGSGSVAGKVVRPLTGSLDEFRVWKLPLSKRTVSSSFNVSLTARDGMTGCWHMGESGSSPTLSATLLDSSGFGNVGTIYNYHHGLRSTGSLMTYDEGELLLSLDYPEVSSYVAQQQASGSEFDRNNHSSIVSLVPAEALRDDAENGDVLRNMLYVIGRFFDEFKVYIDHFPDILRAWHRPHDDVPDALLEEMGRFFGWQFEGSFVDKDALNYLFGRNVRPSLHANAPLERRLYELKNTFWRRVLSELSAIYKAKGSRRSVEYLLRMYGVPRNIVRLKEFGYPPDVGFRTERISADKSVRVARLGLPSASVYVSPFSSSMESLELRVRFPTSETSGMTPTLQTGSLVQMSSPSGSFFLFYTRDVGETTGTIHYSGSQGLLSLGPVGTFDGRWHNVSVVRSVSDSSVTLGVRGLEGGLVTPSFSSSLVGAISEVTVPWSGTIGHGPTPYGTSPSEFWAHEFRAWSRPLAVPELEDHVINFQSFGVDDPLGVEDLDVHLRLDEGLVSDGAGNTAGYFDHISVSHLASGSGFPVSSASFDTETLEYSFIASPERNWTDEHVRSFDSSRVDAVRLSTPNTTLALEFNLVDALNEDISQVISTLDVWNEYVGAPANRYRDEYPDLAALRAIYFRRLAGDLNFRVFSDMLEFFDRSFVDMVRRLLPARAKFVGDEFVVEGHMLERPKHQWPYRRKDREFVLEGVIKVIARD